MRHDVNHTTHAVSRKAFGHVTLVYLNAVNLVDWDVVDREISVAVIDRHSIDKHLHVLALHAADIDLAFAAHAARLADFHARRAVRGVGDGGAGALKFRSIHHLDRFRLCLLVDRSGFVDSFTVNAHLVENRHTNLRIICNFIYLITAISIFRGFFSKKVIKIRHFFSRLARIRAYRFLCTRRNHRNGNQNNDDSYQFICK